MSVLRIVPNLAAQDLLRLADFYRAAFGFEMSLDMGWIAFLELGRPQRIELHAASQGGSGTDLPVISIEVDDLAEAERGVSAAGGEIVYGPVDEPWGLRRFYLRDPEGNLVNVLCHGRQG
ncbi:VOC family protein [Paracoccus marinaquae]|uniref:VOC family protein n=1 Tax=Paracoccus marinaquae TaxID=2841926 RepID=A0ABS6AEZ6_9RHOB|nr:VOC family protein [Paracoccus marinaquae]MBU3029183.1 VOC family protein [Paracoccus marinaquae]